MSEKASLRDDVDLQRDMSVSTLPISASPPLQMNPEIENDDSSEDTVKSRKCLKDSNIGEQHGNAEARQHSPCTQAGLQLEQGPRSRDYRESHGTSQHSKVERRDDKDAERSTSTHNSSSASTNTDLEAQPPPLKPVPVPRSERRGLFARLAIIAEVEDPYAYSRITKWTITFIVAVAAAAAPMGSSIILPSLQPISREFGSEPALTNLSIALYLLALGVFPLWWSSFSESGGRRSVYLISFALFTVFCILAAESTSVGMLVTMRVLSGGAAASVQSVGAGTIADVWEVKERGTAMGIFYLGPLCGPFFAPIIGGALTKGLGWRSAQWYLAILGGLITVGILFCLPETLPRKAEKDSSQKAESRATDASKAAEKGSSVADEAASTAEQGPQSLTRVSSRQSVQQHTTRWIRGIRQTLLDPLSILLLLRHPPILLTIWLASVCFGCLYFLSVSIQTSFSSPPYEYNSLIVGLLYIPNSLGYVTASVFGGRWIDHIMHREADKARKARKPGRFDESGRLVFRPEDRMRENAWLAGILFPGGLIWWGWTIQYGVVWVVPSIANVFFGIGTMLVFGMATTMLTEFLPSRASAGIALNNFVRNMFSAAGAVAAEPLVRKFSNGWLFTIVGIVAFVSSYGVVGAMLRYGERWRTKMGNDLG